MFTSAEDYNQGTGRLSSQVAALFTGGGPKNEIVLIADTVL